MGGAGGIGGQTGSRTRGSRVPSTYAFGFSSVFLYNTVDGWSLGGSILCAAALGVLPVIALPWARG